MSGCRAKLRRTLTASIVGACAGLVILPASPSAADTAYYNYQYTCTGGALLPTQNTKIQVRVAIPKSVRAGERIPLEWTMNASPLASSARFKAGGRLSATGSADVAGLWQGKLDSTGSKDQGELRTGGPLELPTAISGSVATTKEGKLLITPRDLLLDFIPPADQTTTNDTFDATEQVTVPPHQHGPIRYEGSWSYSGKAERPGLGDHQDDVHQTVVKGDSVTVTFAGTGIDYITERHPEMGAMGITLDGYPRQEKPDASLDDDGTSKVTERKAQRTLWSFHNLPYDDDHTLTITNLADNGRFMLVDAFKVFTDAISVPPPHFSTTCTYVGIPTTVTVDVTAAPDGGGHDDDGNRRVTDGDDSARGVIVLSGGGQGHGAPTATATTTAKPKKTSKATRTPQVRVTPKGGAHTGEPSGRNTAAPLLIGYGAALTLGGVAGGVLLRRRRPVRSVWPVPVAQGARAVPPGRAERGSADRGNLG